MSNTNKIRLHTTTVMIGFSSLILAMGAPWKFN